ncbi:MAG: hypothetical protein H6741_06140 [Alphaproteobacteria bacterium]|nr:hypothetical protein [Alphaproteobacteria bacterium]MCB9792289.1 hypothetical protein [Alphaproteobacteria bacterium]
MSRAAQGLNLGLLLLALVQAGGLALSRASTPATTLPLLLPSDPPGALQAPGEAEATLEARAVALGDYLTVEDLARGVLLLERGELEGVPPLSEAERTQVAALLRAADQHRTELLEVEGEIRGVDADLSAVSAELAARLSPAQRLQVRQQRDRVSIGEVERAYWDAVLELVDEADPAGEPPP